MTDELRNAFRIQGPEPPLPDLADVGRRRRRLAWRRSLLTTGVTLFVVVSVMVGATLWPEKDPPAPVGGPNRTTSSPTERAITFAVRAVDQAGLVDWIGTAYAFGRIDEVDGGWEVTFRHLECAARGSGCEEVFPRLVLTVGVRENHLRVIALEGELDARQETSLLGFAERPTPERLGLELLGPRVIRSEGSRPRLLTSWMWAGPLPAAGSAAICRPFLLNSDFERVGSMPPFSFASPGSSPSEVNRLGGLFGAPIPLNARGARLVDGGCRVVEVEGWQPNGPAVISGSREDEVYVRVPLRWSGPVAPVWTTCTAIAFDIDGLVTASHALHTFPTPKFQEGRVRYANRSRVFDWKIDVDPETVRDVDVTCRPWQEGGSG